MPCPSRKRSQENGWSLFWSPSTWQRTDGERWVQGPGGKGWWESSEATTDRHWPEVYEVNLVLGHHTDGWKWVWLTRLPSSLLGHLDIDPVGRGNGVPAWHLWHQERWSIFQVWQRAVSDKLHCGYKDRLTSVWRDSALGQQAAMNLVPEILHMNTNQAVISHHKLLKKCWMVIAGI